MSSKSNKDIKIAIVDDSEVMRDCMNHCLSLWGYSVIIQACNGKDFFDKVDEENLPNICIVDINMPYMNGHETINILKKTWPNIKTIIFSMEIEGKGNTLPNADIVLSKATAITCIKSALQRLASQSTTLF
jgi:DNA-binding NarL/FixJ family response regulator